MIYFVVIDKRSCSIPTDEPHSSALYVAVLWLWYALPMVWVL